MISGILIFVFVLFLFIALFMSVSGYFPFLLIVCFLVICLLSVIVSLSAIKRTKVDYFLKKSIVERDDKIEFVLKRENPRFFECGLTDVYLQIEKDGKVYYKDVVHVYDEAFYNNCFKHCGCYSVKVKKIRYYDVLGIFFKDEKRDDRFDFYVFPKNIELENSYRFENMSYLSDEYSMYKKGDDYTEVFDVHQYREDDQLKHIHWKMSLKRNELFVKEGSFPVLKKTYLCVRQSQLFKENDYILDQFYSLCLLLYKRKEQFSVIYDYEVQEIVCVEDIRESVKRLLEFPQYEIDYSLFDDDFLLVSGQGIEVVHL